MTQRSVRPLLEAVVLGLAWGAVAQVIVTDATGPWVVAAVLFSTKAIWCVPALMAGTRAKTLRRGMAGAVGAELGAIAAYYATYRVMSPGPWADVLSGFDGLALDGVVAGIVFGAAGATAVSTKPWRSSGWAALPTAVLVESVLQPDGPIISELSRQLTEIELVFSGVAFCLIAAYLLRDLYRRTLSRASA